MVRGRATAPQGLPSVERRHRVAQVGSARHRLKTRVSHNHSPERRTGEVRAHSGAGGCPQLTSGQRHARGVWSKKNEIGNRRAVTARRGAAERAVRD